MISLLSIRLPDEQIERVRRNHHDALVELQRLPLSSARILEGVELANGIATPIPHGLGRSPLFVLPSAPRGASSTGRIEEVRDSGFPRDRYVTLRATGWGATIALEVLVL